MDVKIGEYLMSDFGLELLSVDLGKAEVKTNTLDIPGRNGMLDLTEAVTGYPVYRNARHKLIFDFADGSYDAWIAKSSRLRGKIHGRRLPVVLGNDVFFYDARISVDTAKLNQCYSKITIELDAQPYKLALKSSLDDWEWDSFNFEEDVIREYKDIAVPTTLTIVGGVMPTGCVFRCSGNVSVEYDGITCKLPEGISTIPDILITEGEHVLKFTGSGTVSVEYREGRF